MTGYTKCILSVEYITLHAENLGLNPYGPANSSKETGICPVQQWMCFQCFPFLNKIK